jgi:hypothetical protein
MTSNLPRTCPRAENAALALREVDVDQPRHHQPSTSRPLEGPHSAPSAQRYGATPARHRLRTDGHAARLRRPLKSRRDTAGTRGEGVLHNLFKTQRFFRIDGLKRKPTEGRIAIVTDAGRDTVDAAASGACGDRRAGSHGPVSGRRTRGRTMLDLRTVKPCGPGTRCWCQVSGGKSARPGLTNL